MSEFKELIKSFPKSREYVRDFFVYGFKTREEFSGFSSRTYDNERRRLESWLAGFVKQKYCGKEKNIYLSIDSNSLDTNPLYRVWKAKSFTDNDIMLHFYILDYLEQFGAQSADRITDGILAEYGFVFEVQTVRRKCSQYAKEGILEKKKRGKEILYQPGLPFERLLSFWPGLGNAVKLYQLFSPLGIVGNTMMEHASLTNDLFRVKHNFFVHTLEDEMLLLLLSAMHREKAVLLTVKSTRTDNRKTAEGVPLKIFISTCTGRRYVILYVRNKKRFVSVRLDAVKAVEAKESCPDFRELLAKLERNREKAWGISFQNSAYRRTEHVKLTLHIDERTEGFLVSRLKREGKGGVIRRIAPDTFTYEKEVFDANEMLPWIRTFLGRIVKLESDSKRLNLLFERDFWTMYRMYCKE